MADIKGTTVIARSLKRQGIDVVFGVVGFPVMDLAEELQREGLRFYGFRNEQAASYAAGAAGYLTGRPGACVTVSGPGMIHGIAGLSNAWANCWPMMLLGGANDTYQNERGGFQEAPQIEAARPFVKLATRPDSVARVPEYLEKATRTALYGRPGAVYVDLPNDIISGTADEATIAWSPRSPDAPKSLADPAAIDRALAALRSAQRPLVVIGKGAAYARAEVEVRRFVEATRLPFLASPMGKGVLPDDHALSVAPARSLALAEADVVFLVGARLNWILHFGLPPRFAKDVRIVQLDVAAEEIGTNVPTEAALVGDAGAILGQMNAALAAEPWQFARDSEWWTKLGASIAQNQRQVEAMMNDDGVPMGYYRVMREIREAMPRDAFLCSEGANTMDIGRGVLPNFAPRLRLDAGSFGTMGVGLAFAIAAAALNPGRKVVCLEGDSAFGFSGMEVETACRYKLPITFIVVNNNGITGGLDELTNPPLPHVYTPNARYEKVIEAFGGKGWFVTTPEALKSALKAALACDVPTLVNVMIDPKAGRKPQKFEWLTKK
ncbi:MAG: oxalyl-CoA decarboxylase [Gammaproteobacteria bacterium]|nr:oxalyl-CoA decarboxylase [Gammaproteobacteria bacterium]